MCAAPREDHAADMTTTTFSSPTLERPHDAPLAGVCTALARTTGTGPVLWRVLTVVLTFFGGLGIALYLAGVVLIRAEGQQQSIAQRLLSGPDRRLSGRQVTAVALLLVAVGVLAGHTDGLVALAVGAGLALLWVRGSRGTRPAGSAPPLDVPVSAAAAAPFDAVAAGRPYEPPPPRPRSPLTPLTLSLALVVTAVLVLLGVTVTSVPVEAVIATALGVVGLGLLAGAWLGRATGLVVAAVLLALALAGALALGPVVDRGAGDPTWRPAGSASYQLGAGGATLDLTGLAAGGGLTGRS